MGKNLLQSDEIQKLKTLIELLPNDRNANNGGFLSIIGCDTKELVITRLYTYFLNLNHTEDKEISFCFIESLKDLISEKSKNGKDFKLQNWKASTNIHTQSGNYIDLLIEAGNDEAIIIENKIFHKLANDLSDYISHPKAILKLGIILSIYPVPQSDFVQEKDHYINILHSEWISKVEKRISERSLISIHYPSLENRNYVYLLEFISCISKLSNMQKMTESVRQYFENMALFNIAKATTRDAEIYTTNQLKKVAGHFDWKTSNWSDNWVEIWNNKNIFLIIDLENFWNARKRITVLIVAFSSLRERAHEIRAKIKDFKKVGSFKVLEERTNAYEKIASFEYEFESTHEIENLGEALGKKIKSDIMPAVIELQKIFCT